MEKNNIVQILAAQHQEVWTGSPWYGSSVQSGLSGITPQQATYRLSGQHNIAEIVNHMVQWKKFVLEKIRGNAAFDIELNSKDDWTTIDRLDETSWNQIVESFNAVTASLLSEMRLVQENLLRESVPGRKYSYSQLIEGIRDHDIYHLGQVIILKKIAQHEI
jgi:uncharacterized damage-inducible protein DinB